MINLESRNRGKPLNPSQMITGLKCAVCGNPLPDKTWQELAQSRNDYCPDCGRHAAKAFEAEDMIMSCIRKHRNYWSIKSPKWCQDKGCYDCTECTLHPTECVVP